MTTIGYTSGVFDILHYGHINILQKASNYCYFLIVGLTTDDECFRVKKKKPLMSYDKRLTVLSAIKYIDEVIPQSDSTFEGKLKIIKKHNVDIVVVGSDHKGSKIFTELEKRVKVVYLPYTEGVSSSKINRMLDEYRDVK